MMRSASADRRNLRLLWVGQFINTAGLMMLVPIMPFYVHGMGIDGVAEVQTWAGVAIAAPALSLIVATPLWGRLGDRIGRKWMVVRALAGLAAAMVVMVSATSPMLLLAGRLLQGGLGGVVEAAAAFAGASGPTGKRGSTLGKSFSATAAGALVGPLAGGALVGTGGLRELMLAIAALAVILGVACAVGLREPSSTTTKEADAPRPRRPGSPRHALHPPKPRLRDHVPGAIPLAIAAIAAYFGVYGLIPVFAEHVSATAGVASAGMWVGVLQSLTWGATLLASFWWGRRNDRDQRPVPTFALAAGGCAIGIAAQALPLDPVALIPLRLLQGFCFAALAQSLFHHVSTSAPAGHTSGAVGSANSFLLIGQSAGPLLAGPLIALLPVPAVITLMGIACGVGALLALAVARSQPATQRDDFTVEFDLDATIEFDARTIREPGRRLVDQR
ncbi:MAG: MFS transporter [Actinophytocola sp.]|nr:MFS transporter [Actinophytocola sp.]